MEKQKIDATKNPFIVLLVGEKLTIVDFVAFLLICVSVPIQKIGKVGMMFNRKRI